MTLHATKLDLGWFNSHLLDDILPKWLAAVTDQGLFLPHFDRRWQPLHRNFGTLVSQCRLLYNFSQGYALTGNKLYLDAVEGGASFLLEHFRDKQYGGWYWSCNLDGEPKERRKDGYGHAFTLFGLAHAYRCTGNPALQEAMFHTWDVMTQHFGDEHGGFRWRMTEGFEAAESTKSQNPVMHLFEALLAAATVGGAEGLLQEARRVGDFVLFKLVHTADRRLPEVYDEEWVELPLEPGDAEKYPDTRRGRLDIGHAFEWAYLTSYAQEKGLPAYYGSYANSFMLYGLTLGFDWQAGGIYSPATPTGQLISQRKGWWEQCEAIRALLNFVVVHKRADLVEPLQRTIQFVQTSFVDPEYGGWYPNIGPEITPTETHATFAVGSHVPALPTAKQAWVASMMEKGNEWKVDYHVVGMCMEAIRLADHPTAL